MPAIRGLDPITGQPVYVEAFQGDGSEQNPFRMARGDKLAHDKLDALKASVDALRTSIDRVARVTPISLSGAGDTTIVTPSAGKALRIGSLTLTAASLVAITIKEGTTAISAPMQLTDLAQNFSPPLGLATGQVLAIGLGAAVSVTGFVTWWEI